MVALAFFFSWAGFAIFLGLTALTICLGHSIGMHRLLIHRSFAAPKWFECILVYLGVLVGMAGPIGMIRLHDTRDWAQRQQDCHDYFAHRQGFWTDLFWQNHCRIELCHPPRFCLEPEVARSAYYTWLERTWMLQQLPLALVLFLAGGWGWLLWGVAARVAVCLHGHWLIGYFAHRNGGQHWTVEGAAVQGFNLPWAALLSFGESWHNNHHAFPASAQLGIYSGEWDPGWWVLKGFRALGLVSNLATPDSLPERHTLKPIAQ